jgi:hypothetical protein
MQNNRKPEIGAKKLLLSRETLRTLTPSNLGEVRGGISYLGSLMCEIVTAPETFDGPQCMPGSHI